MWWDHSPWSQATQQALVGMYLESLEAYGKQLMPLEHIIAFAASAELELSETVWINSRQLWILHNSFIHVPVKGIKI